MENNKVEPLVRIRDLKVSFRLDRAHVFEAVKGISFDIPKNATVALVGESGSGKSVTSLAVLGLLPPENSIVDPSSSILFGERNIVGLPPSELRSLRGAEISMIFLAYQPPCPVADNRATRGRWRRGS